MTNARAIFWLVALLLLTTGASVFLHIKGGANRVLVQRTRLRDAAADIPVAIAVTRTNAPATQLVQKRRWRLESPYSAAADERVVLRLLDVLSMTEIEAATTDQELLRLGRTRADFGLTNPAVRVTLTDAKQQATTYAFGALTPAGDGRYVAVGDEPSVYVVSTNAFAVLDLPPEGFRRRAAFTVGPESVLSLDVKRGTGSFMRFVREGELWQMTEPRQVTASAARMKKLLEGVMSATAVDFVWPTGAAGEPTEASAALLASYGLDPESAVTVTAKCTDGFNRRISFGKEASGGRVYALVQNGGAIVTMAAEPKDVALAGISEFTDTRLFPLEESAVTRVSVTDGETSYLLARGEDGAWLLESPVAAPTDSAGVSAFLARICALRLEDVVTNGVTVAVTPGDKPFVVAREAVLGGVRLDDLRSREIVRIDPTTVRRLVVTDTRRSEPTAVVHDTDRRAWNVESSARAGVVSEHAIVELLTALESLRAERIAKLKVTAADLRTYGLDKPWLTVAIDVRSEDAVRRNILVGASAPGGAYATLGATDAVFVLSAETIRRLSTPLVREEP